MDNRNKNKQVWLHHSKKLFIANQMTSRLERQFTKWENMFANRLSSEVLTSPKYIRSSYNSIVRGGKKNVTQFKNGLRSWIDIFPKKTYIWPTGICKSIQYRIISSLQSLRCVRLFATPCTPGFPVHHQLLELAQTHVHRVSDNILSSHLLPSPFLPVFNLSQHQGLFKWVSSLHQVAKVLEFQLQHQSFW